MTRSTVKLIIVALAAWASSAYASEATIDYRNFSESERLHYEALIDAELNYWLNLRPRFPGQRGPFLIKSRIDTVSGSLTVELGREFGPHSADPEMEDISKEIDAYVERILPTIPTDVELRFGGGDLYFWFPDLAPLVPVQPRSSRKRRSVSNATTVSRVLVSAGHGAYFHHGFMKWTTQRDAHNGVLEDYLTQDFAERLGRKFHESKPKIMPFYTRSFSNELHEESNLPWRNLAARYWIKEVYPSEVTIWNSLESSESPQRERLEDLNSRVLLANHLNVDAAIHLHTNAAEHTVRGMRAYFQKGSTEGEKLANSLLCYAKERLASDETFKNYAVGSVAAGKNYAELRGANMPSALVELGFHTNAEDAQAMSRWRFQEVVVTGLRKGYQEYLSGHGCEPFKLTSARNIGLQEGSDLTDLELSYSGYPRFPVWVTAYHDKNISGNDKCHMYSMSESILSRPEDGLLKGLALCPPGVTQSKLKIKAKDADGVVAFSDLDLTCPGRDWDQSDDCNLEPEICDCSRFDDYVNGYDPMRDWDDEQDAGLQNQSNTSEQ